MAVSPELSINHQSLVKLVPTDLRFKKKVTQITFCLGLKVVWMGESHIRSVLLRTVIASVQTYKKYPLDIGILGQK